MTHEQSNGTQVKGAVERVVYLGISGVLHPSETEYRLLYDKLPWSDGHRRFEGVPALENMLKPWQDAQIVLTSANVAKDGMASVMSHLGSDLARRVLSNTYEDLTQRVFKPGFTRSGEPTRRHRTPEDYWRMNKSAIVKAHVEWLQPHAWIAIDDEDILWSADQLEHLLLVDGTKGLLDDEAQANWLSLAEQCFGVAGIEI